MLHHFRTKENIPASEFIWEVTINMHRFAHLVTTLLIHETSRALLKRPKCLVSGFQGFVPDTSICFSRMAGKLLFPNGDWDGFELSNASTNQALRTQNPAKVKNVYRIALANINVHLETR